jgi:hypothetical protein
LEVDILLFASIPNASLFRSTWEINDWRLSLEIYGIARTGVSASLFTAPFLFVTFADAVAAAGTEWEEDD